MCVPLLDVYVVAAQLCVRWGQHPCTKPASSRWIGLICGVLVSWWFSVVSAPWTEGSNLLLFFKKQRKHKSSGKDHLQDVKSYRCGNVYWRQQAAWNDSSEVRAHLSSSHSSEWSVNCENSFIIWKTALFIHPCMLEGKRAGHIMNIQTISCKYHLIWDLEIFFSDLIPTFSDLWDLLLEVHSLAISSCYPSFLRKSFYTIVLYGSSFIAALLATLSQI